MKTLSIDIETYGSIDLTKSGVYKYTQNDFEILLIAYAYDDEEIKIIDLKNNEKISTQEINELVQEISTYYGIEENKISITESEMRK